MSELRQKFESLPEVIDSLSCHIRIGSDGLYYTSLINFEKLVIWLNGAWYAFQEQQKKIDELAKHVACIKTIVSECDENTDSSWILGNIDGFIECMENILNDQSN